MFTCVATLKQLRIKVVLCCLSRYSSSCRMFGEVNFGRNPGLRQDTYPGTVQCKQLNIILMLHCTALHCTALYCIFDLVGYDLSSEITATRAPSSKFQLTLLVTKVRKAEDFWTMCPVEGEPKDNWMTCLRALGRRERAIISIYIKYITCIWLLYSLSNECWMSRTTSVNVK